MNNTLEILQFNLRRNTNVKCITRRANARRESDSRCRGLPVNTNVCNPRGAMDPSSLHPSTIFPPIQCRLRSERRFCTRTAESRSASSPESSSFRRRRRRRSWSDDRSRFPSAICFWSASSRWSIWCLSRCPSLHSWCSMKCGTQVTNFLFRNSNTPYFYLVEYGVKN